jgi:hypothetical protein
MRVDVRFLEMDGTEEGRVLAVASNVGPAFVIPREYERIRIENQEGLYQVDGVLHYMSSVPRSADTSDVEQAQLITIAVERVDVDDVEEDDGSEE